MFTFTLLTLKTAGNSQKIKHEKILSYNNFGRQLKNKNNAVTINKNLSGTQLKNKNNAVITYRYIE